MSGERRARPLGRAALIMFLALGATMSAQRGRGAGPAGPPPTPRGAAPADLTGNWVSVVSEDWQWRMVTPAKGDYASVPLNPAGRKLADAWTPADEGSCKAYGAPALLRMPGRVRITWEDDLTLKIETDAGVQTRRLRFSPAASGPRDLQGHSVAEWQIPPGTATGSGAEGGSTRPVQTRWGSLKVVTTNLLPGWLRTNGVPYSENAVLTEYFDRFTDGTSEWFTVTTIVEDPANLTMPFVISSNFKREPDGSRWNPTPCKST
jgi:hypothetical protein